MMPSTWTNAEYSETELGLLPLDWGIKNFGDLFNFSNGVNAEKKAYGSGYPFINVLETINHSHLTGAEITGHVNLSRLTAEAYAVKPGDVLFNRTS